jgi:hypothetical protein
MRKNDKHLRHEANPRYIDEERKLHTVFSGRW